MPDPLPFQPQRALAIGAHPDDVEFYAGGTLLRLRAEGATTALVVASDGGKGGRGLADAPAVRRAEQAKAADVLGVTEWSWLGYPDGSLAPGDPLRGDLAGAVRRFRPEVVLTHDPRTFFTVYVGIAQPGHSDHRATGQAVLDAIYPRSASPNFYPEQLGGGDGVRPWYPREVWLFDTATPDLRVDVTEHFAAKEASLRAHDSQERAAGGLLHAAHNVGGHWGGEPGRFGEAFVRLRLY
jgi:LmbE family N-acetylglucosaminyl deacetylase